MMKELLQLVTAGFLLICSAYVSRAGRMIGEHDSIFRNIICRVTAIGVVICGLALFAGPCTAYTHPYHNGRRTMCQSNLHQLDLALQASCYPPNEFYPENLADLDPDDVSPNVFVCPESGNEPGELKDVMTWTDYIYVPGQSPAMNSDTWVFLCPYHTKGANYLRGDHGCTWIQGEDVVAEQISHMRRLGYPVWVSTRIRERLLGRYKSSRGTRKVGE